MRSLGHHVMREDQRLAANFQHRAIIVQSACGGVGRQAAQLRNEVSLAAQRVAFPIPSRIPLTNLASRSSKKAFATSTYSLIALAMGTDRKSKRLTSSH